MSNTSTVLKYFILYGFVFYVLEATILLASYIVWVDFINFNPYRSRENAELTLLLSPVYGCFLALLTTEFPLVMAAIIAVIAQLRLSRVPIWTLVIMLPFCLGAAYLQLSVLISAFPGDFEFNLWSLLFLSALETPVLLGCLLLCGDSKHKFKIQSQ